MRIEYRNRLVLRLSLFLSILCCYSCLYFGKNEHPIEDGSVIVDEFIVRKGRNLTSKEWKCSTIQFDRICCPISWKEKKQTKTLYQTSINNQDSNTFFCVVRYDKTTNSVDAKSYLNALYSQLYYDSIEIFNTYSCKELKFQDKMAYYGEYNTTISGKKYISFSMVFEFDNLIYDIVLKVLNDDREALYEVYQDILYNYKSNNLSVFSEDDNLISFTEIDLSKL